MNTRATSIRRQAKVSNYRSSQLIRLYAKLVSRKVYRPILKLFLRQGLNHLILSNRIKYGLVSEGQDDIVRF